jgi:hypothetical protein
MDGLIRCGMGIIHNLPHGRGYTQSEDAHHNNAGRLYSSHPVHFVLRLAFPDLKYRDEVYKSRPKSRVESTKPMMRVRVAE